MTPSELDRALEKVLTPRPPELPIWSLERLAGTLDHKPGEITAVDEHGWKMGAIYLAAYNRVLALWKGDQSLPEPPAPEGDVQVGLQQIMRWCVKAGTTKPKLPNEPKDAKPPARDTAQAETGPRDWKPPAGYLNAKEIDKKYQVRRPTLQNWQNKDDVPNGPLAGRLVKAPDSTHTFYYPEEWVKERVKTWQPKKHKR